MKFYLDSSVIVDFITEEPKARAIISHLDGQLFTSKLGRAETFRTLQKSAPDFIDKAYSFFETIICVDVSDEILGLLETFGAEITLKTSDAIHIATASIFLDEKDALVTLDKQMKVNAQRLGINLFS